MNKTIKKLPNGDFEVMDNVPHGADNEDAPWNEKEKSNECECYEEQEWPCDYCIEQAACGFQILDDNTE